MHVPFIFSEVALQGLKKLQVLNPDMPLHDGEEYVLVVGATRNGLAELNVAMFWPLSAEVFSTAKQDDPLTCYIACYIAFCIT